MCDSNHYLTISVSGICVVVLNLPVLVGTTGLDFTQAFNKRELLNE